MDMLDLLPPSPDIARDHADAWPKRTCKSSVLDTGVYWIKESKSTVQDFMDMVIDSPGSMRHVDCVRL